MIDLAAFEKLVLENQSKSSKKKRIDTLEDADERLKEKIRMIELHYLNKG